MASFYPMYLYSLFFFYTAYTFLGWWALSLNRSALLNRLFFGMSLSASLWVLAAALSTSAPNYAEALFWRRITAFGWGLIYSLLVHFACVLTNRRRFTRNVWFYLLIYGPSLVTILVYAVFNSTAAREFHLVHTKYGWGNVPLASFWDLFFNIYYILFTLLFLSILIVWRTGADRRIKGQADRIIVSLAVAIILGTISDILLNRITSVPLPSLGPLLIIVPLIGIMYSVKKYGMMAPVKSSREVKAGYIFSEYEEKRFFRYIAMFFIVLSLMNLLHESLVNITYHQLLKFSFAIFYTGVVIFYIPNFIVQRFHRHNLVIPITCFAVAAMIYHYSRFGSGDIIWALPILVLFIMIFFDNRFAVFAVSSAILTVMVLMRFLPLGIQHDLPAAVFSQRLLLVLVSTFTAVYIQRIYTMRLRENLAQMAFQQMVLRISSQLVSVNETNFDDRMFAILNDIGEYYHAGRVCLFTLSRDTNSIGTVLDWCAEEPFEHILSKDTLDRNFLPYVNLAIKFGGIYVADVAASVEIMEPVKTAFLKRNSRSVFCIPIASKGRALGALNLEFRNIHGFGSAEKGSKQEIAIPINLIADSLIKIDSEKRINYLAFYDPLTELPNRILFNDRLMKALPLAARTEKIVAVIMMDLDSFKIINDSMGHDVGDLLLKKVTDVLSGSLREYDTMSRFGGDEFLFILSQLEDETEAALVAAKLLDLLSKPIRIAEEEFFISASFGIAIGPRDGSDVDVLVKNADIAMYFSKNHGKNQYTFYSPDMKDYSTQKIHLVSDLYRALEKEQFLLHYQPQVDLKTREIVGMEALIRWNHPERGIISPFEFIPLAEEIGLIPAIGRWVLLTACRHNKRLQEQGFPPIKVAVNLSLKQFFAGDLVKTVEDILASTELDPLYLELEITESIFLEDSLSVSNKLRRLRGIGITISIDDFGTEYSSLSRLKNMHVDRIKIDKQFIQGISLDEDDESIIEFIVNLSKNLGLKVIAEGVETMSQLEFLADKNCDQIQGFLFYKPMSFAEIQTVLDCT